MSVKDFWSVSANRLYTVRQLAVYTEDREVLNEKRQKEQK